MEEGSSCELSPAGKNAPPNLSVHEEKRDEPDVDYQALSGLIPSEAGKRI
jgi:hypothetical protein